MMRQVDLLLEIPSAGQDAEFQVHRVRGRESMSQLYSYEIEFWATSSRPLDEDDLIGSSASFAIEQDGLEVRRVHGMLQRIDRVYRVDDRYTRYRVVLVPHAHLLQLIETLDVFAGAHTAVDLITMKLEQCEVDLDVTQLVATYPTRDFWVQYKETDWDFVCRRAEHHGISFCFTQEGTDRIVFHDDTTTLRSKHTLGLVARVGDQGVMSLESHVETVPSLHMVMDYNEDTPDIELTCSDESDTGFAGGVVEYGPNFLTTTEGDAVAKVRRERTDCRRRVWEGSSNLLGLAAGERITIEGADDDLDVLLERVELTIEIPKNDDAGEAQFRIDFVAVDGKLPYRPPRRTRVPKVEGLLSAIIEPQDFGQVGDYARLDASGRYMVKFRFDSGELDGRASCPVRLIQQTVGADYGMHFPLKPGVEVAVGFVNGDPDRPVIVGALHNATTPAVVRDQNASFSMIKTRSGINLKMKDA